MLEYKLVNSEHQPKCHCAIVMFTDKQPQIQVLLVTFRVYLTLSINYTIMITLCIYVCMHYG